MDQEDRIRETALQLFISVGYSGVTMDQIARNCGVGKATLYKYFASKEALILSCIDYFTSQIETAAANVIADSNLSLQHKVAGVITPVVRFVSRVNTNALDDIQRNVPQAYEKIEANRKRVIFSNINAIVSEGKESGVFRQDVDGRLVTHMLIGTISHLSKPQVLDEIGLSLGQLLKMTLSIVWEGCLTEKGRMQLAEDKNSHLV